MKQRAFADWLLVSAVQLKPCLGGSRISSTRQPLLPSDVAGPVQPRSSSLRNMVGTDHERLEDASKSQWQAILLYMRLPAANARQLLFHPLGLSPPCWWD